VSVNVKRGMDTNKIHEKISQFWLAKSSAFFFEIPWKKKKYSPNFLIFLFFYFSNFLIFLLSKCDLRTRLHNFFMYIIMVSRTIWKNIHSWVFQTLVLRTHSILIVFEKLTRAFFFPNCTRNHISYTHNECLWLQW
jgi:hypothetical protein